MSLENVYMCMVLIPVDKRVEERKEGAKGD